MVILTVIPQCVSIVISSLAAIMAAGLTTLDKGSMGVAVLITGAGSINRVTASYIAS